MVTAPPGVTRPEPSRPALGPDPRPFQVHLGIPTDPSHAAVVLWRTRDDATPAAVVEYGVGDVLDHRATGVTMAYPAGGGAVRIHEVTLCGLPPDTTLRYRVGGDSADGRAAWSEVFTLRTFPAPGAEAELTVAVAGDSRGGWDMWGSLLAHVEATSPPDVILYTGDAVRSGDVQPDWDAFLAAAAPTLTRAPLLFAHGNHEHNAASWYAQFSQPVPEDHFAVALGPLHVTALNDTPLRQPQGLGASLAEQALFLDQSQEQAITRGVPWRVVMHHRPIWSVGSPGTELEFAL